MDLLWQPLGGICKVSVFSFPDAISAIHIGNGFVSFGILDDGLMDSLEAVLQYEYLFVRRNQNMATSVIQREGCINVASRIVG